MSDKTTISIEYCPTTTTTVGYSETYGYPETYGHISWYNTMYSNSTWYRVTRSDIRFTEYSADLPGINPETIKLNVYSNYIVIKVNDWEQYIICCDELKEKSEVIDAYYKWGQIIFTIKKTPEEGKNIPIKIIQ